MGNLCRRKYCFSTVLGFKWLDVCFVSERIWQLFSSLGAFPHHYVEHVNLSFSFLSPPPSRYDKVLFAALQALKAQHPHVNPVHRVALRELCGQFYLLLASYMYWSHRFKVSFTASHAVKYVSLHNIYT